MFSRAHVLLEIEVKKLMTNPLWGIKLWPVSDDSVFEWMAQIEGLQETDWQGVVLTVYIRFNEHYNVQPPEVVFLTIPFHPNIDATTGRPCVDFLDDPQSWNEDFSLSMVLISLQVLLSNPVCANAVNEEAAQLYMTTPEAYREHIIWSNPASQHIGDDKCAARGKTSPMPELIQGSTKSLATPSQPPSCRSAVTRAEIIHLSFEDYHRVWLDIATSKAASDGILSYSSGTSASSKKQLYQPNLHSRLSKDNFNSGRSVKAEKQTIVNKLNQVYVPQWQTPISSGADSQPRSDHFSSHTRDVWEEEADELLTWTHQLDSHNLDGST